MAKIIEKIKNSSRVKNGLSEFKKEFRGQMITFVIGAFSFVAALFWRDAIQKIVQTFIPIESEAWYFKIFIALLVSSVAVVAIILLSKFSKGKQ